MREFDVNIEEMIVQTYKVKAKNLDDAYEKAVQQYKAGLIVLDNANLVCKQIQIEDKAAGISTEWSEF